MSINEAYTFDDLSLVPHYSETDSINEISTSTKITNNIKIALPILSAAMDTVTESRMAIIMARNGGAGIIHRNMSVDKQILEIRRVKKSESGMINDPVTIEPNDTIQHALEIMSDFRISGLPVVENDKLVGILTNRDVRFVTDYINSKVKNYMTTENLIKVTEGLSLDDAKILMHQYRVEKLLVVDKRDNDKLIGMITIKDINKNKEYPNSSHDKKNRLIVGAAVEPRYNKERVDALLKTEADFLVIDSAHGHSKTVINTIRKIKEEYPNCNLVAGNVATYEGAKDLFIAGADAVKVGVGASSVCETGIIAGTGVPQLTAIMEAAKAGYEFGRPIIADGGIKYSGDIVKALAAGASSVVLGALLAGTEECPGGNMTHHGHNYKTYHSMETDDDIIQHYGTKSIFGNPAEQIAYRGKVADIIFQLSGGLRSGMLYNGAATINDLQNNAEFVKISGAGLKEIHVRGKNTNKNVPDYQIKE